MQENLVLKRKTICEVIVQSFIRLIVFISRLGRRKTWGDEGVLISLDCVLMRVAIRGLRPCINEKDGEGARVNGPT